MAGNTNPTTATTTEAGDTGPPNPSTRPDTLSRNPSNSTPSQLGQGGTSDGAQGERPRFSLFGALGAGGTASPADQRSRANSAASRGPGVEAGTEQPEAEGIFFGRSPEHFPSSQ